MVRKRHIAVVLNGGDSDKDAFQAAVRMAARENARVRVVLGPGCSREMYEKHLDFVLWDVQVRLRLPAPEIRFESRLDVLDVQVIEAPEEPSMSRRDS